MRRISIALLMLAGMLLTLGARAQEISGLSAAQDISQSDLDALDLIGLVIPIPQINFGKPPKEFVGSPATECFKSHLVNPCLPAKWIRIT